MQQLIHQIGNDFIKQVGYLDERYASGEYTGVKVYFTVYYGLVDSEGHSNVPIYWVACSEEESTRDYIESVANMAAEKMYRD